MWLEQLCSGPPWHQCVDPQQQAGALVDLFIPLILNTSKFVWSRGARSGTVSKPSIDTTMTSEALSGRLWTDPSAGSVSCTWKFKFHFMCRCFNGLTPHHLWSLWGEERVREWVWPVLDVLIIHHWQVPRKLVFFNIFLMAHSKVMSIRWLRLKTPWHFNQEQTWKNFVLLFFLMDSHVLLIIWRTWFCRERDDKTGEGIARRGFITGSCLVDNPVQMNVRLESRQQTGTKLESPALSTWLILH